MLDPLIDYQTNLKNFDFKELNPNYFVNPFP